MSRYKWKRGLPAILWGPGAHIFSHAITLQNHASPIEENHYYQLNGENLSCSSCTKAYANFRKRNPYNLESKQKRQLSHLLHDVHNEVNQKNGKEIVSYEQNEKWFANLSPKIWILALVDFLLSCGVNQIHKDTQMKKVRLKKKRASDAEQTYLNLLPIHQLILFLTSSTFLSSAKDDSNKTIEKFLYAAKEGKTSLLEPSLYDLKELKKRDDIKYLSEPFIQRLEQVRNFAIPESAENKLLNRAKLFLVSKDN